MNIKSILILLLAWSYFTGCGGKKEQSAISAENKVTVSKDNSTSAEQGGYGFEAIAEKLGYQTYTFSEKDGNFFGDPKAVKGGILHYIHSLFPRTMRIIGQNSNQMINTRIIQALCYESLMGQHPAT